MNANQTGEDVPHPRSPSPPELKTSTLTSNHIPHLGLPPHKYDPAIQSYLYLIGKEGSEADAEGWERSIELGIARLRTELSFPYIIHSGRSEPFDPKAYLYLVGAENPTKDGKDFSAGMAAGVERLRDARARAYGLFFVGSPSKKAMKSCPNFPWLWGLTHAEVLAASEATKIRYPRDQLYTGPVTATLAFDSTFMVLGNVRVPLPEGLVGANNAQWLDVIAFLYSTVHPAWVKTNFADDKIWPKDGAVRRFRDDIVWNSRTGFGCRPASSQGHLDWEDAIDQGDFEDVI
ncbi:uncharacterized protein CcaverHIS019_0608640 [Cutaneotrichosporon cavernicola]|uniref:Uncharacterized protein n=1 Tax=Cutaneotrichosporon cavernicola TaxID=279322 RepID=A0AA48L9I7_9TREE|nr:uncharacterized protein CcaverHIS019_0608640 [Cutaneotrichosporon cavernicola]BEI94405.1 hypothetical protein CcaverHIS019_0608640 [Cutaneotrichosporon cavernicola]BEJ09943.1 hypothetical protein CcaverHIS641_0608580 [Cutaneotrichosporon cavernicola]